MVTNLERFDSNGIELIINTTTGESFASVSGYARMAEKDKSTISRRLKTVASNTEKKAEIVTTTGLKTVSLISEEQISEWIVDDNPTMAKQLLKLGVRVYLHKLAGYEVTSTAVTPKIPQTYAEALLEAGRLALENEKLTAKIKQDAPLVDYADAVRFSDDSVDFLTYAKMINTGRTRLFRKMREAGVIMKHTTLPYQNLIDSGFFEVSQEVTPDGRLRPFALVTGKGQLWLKQKLDSLESSIKSFELELDLGI